MIRSLATDRVTGGLTPPLAKTSSFDYHRLTHPGSLPMATSTTRRDVLLAAAAAPLFASHTEAAEAAGKTYRIGVLSAAIRGKPQPTNGHTWHFAQYLHPDCNLDAIKKYLDPGSAEYFRKMVRNPKFNWDVL